MSQNRTVILVEDDEMIRDGLATFLELEGYHVVCAENGQKGLEAIRKSKGIRRVLLDLQMPVMTGEQLLEALTREENAEFSQIPVLVITARGEGFNHTRAAGVLRKPVELDLLLERVHACCF